jgi:putative NADPH-quinone reductase
MRILAIHAHPTRDSFNSDLHRAVLERLRTAHEIEDTDLYAERFDAVLDAPEFRAYATDYVPEDLKPHVERLRRAQALLFMFPTWNYGMPAIVKGYFDRVWKPGVAFELVNGRPHPTLRHITHVGVITTYGSPWAYNKLFMFEPNKRVFMRGFAGLMSKRVVKLWLAQYGEDRLDDGARKAFIAKCLEKTAKWAAQPAR